MPLPQHPEMRTDAAGNLFLNFGSYGREVELACFSGDGNRVLTVRDVGVAQIRDAESGEVLAEIRPESPLSGSRKGPTSGPFEVFIESAALNQAGDRALLGLNDGTAGVFVVDDGRRLSTMHRPDCEPAAEWELVRIVAYSADGTLAAAGFRGRTVGVWDAQGTELRALLRPREPERRASHSWFRDTLTTSLAFSRDSRYVFGGCADMTAFVWELATGKVVVEAIEHAENVLALQPFDGGILWATTGGSVWRGERDQAPERLIAAGETWTEVFFSRDGRQMLARSGGRVVRWSLAEDSSLELATLPTESFWSEDAVTLGFLPGSSRAYYPKSGNELCLAREGDPGSLRRDAQLVRTLPSPTGELLAIEGWTDSVELWDTSTARVVRKLDAPGGVGAMAFSRTGELFAVGLLGDGGPGDIRPVHVFATETGKRRWTLHGHTHQVQAVAFGPDSKWVVSANLDRSVRLWSLQTKLGIARGRELARLEYEDLEFGELAVLSSGVILVFRESRIEAWRGLREKLWTAELPPSFQRVWKLDLDESCIWLSTDKQRIVAWSYRRPETRHHRAGYRTAQDRPRPK